jgi:pyrroline-5-carboxylate reductase
MALSQRIAFIGAGNMAMALIEGLIASGTVPASKIVASDPRGEVLAQLAKKHGFAAAASNLEAVGNADVVVLSIKPQVFPTVLPELAPALARDPLVISIAAGVPLAAIEAWLGANVRVVRAMPNTPALVAVGATAIAAGARATDDDMRIAEAVFSAVGLVKRVEERFMNAVTALSGSGPAYVYLLAEAMTEAGIAAGLPAEVAAALATQTVAGAGKLLGQSSDPPATLRRNVTSPGGTTHAAIEIFEAGALRELVTKAVLAATKRGAELGEEAAKKLAAG